MRPIPGAITIAFGPYIYRSWLDELAYTWSDRRLEAERLQSLYDYLAKHGTRGGVTV